MSGLIELLSSTHGAMPVGLRIVRPLVICGAIVAAAPDHVAGAKLCMVSLSHPFPSLPPSVRRGQARRSCVLARGRAGRQSVQSLFKARCQPVNRGQFVKAAAAPPLRGTRKSEEGRKKGRKQRVLLSPLKLQSLPRSYMDAGKGEICE